MTAEDIAQDLESGGLATHVHNALVSAAEQGAAYMEGRLQQARPQLFSDEDVDLAFNDDSSRDAWWIDVNLFDEYDSELEARPLLAILTLTDHDALQLAEKLLAKVREGHRHYGAGGRQLVGGYEVDIKPCVTAGKHIRSQRHRRSDCPFPNED